MPKRKAHPGSWADRPPPPASGAAASPLAPSVGLLVKLGSIAVHADEFLSPGGHEYDRIALEQLLNDPDVRAWLAAMDGLAMLPKKR